MTWLRAQLRLIYSQLVEPILDDFSVVLGEFFHLLRLLLEWMTADLFAYHRRAASRRWILITVFLAVVWAAFAYGARQVVYGAHDSATYTSQIGYTACMLRAALSSDPQKSPDQRCYRYEIGRSFTFRPLIFEVPFQLLFAPNIFRHVLVIMFAFWLSFKAASHYTSTLFETAEPAVGEHFILQTALVNPYNTLHIQEGIIDKYEAELPLAKIGGPGKVLMHLENAALFERMDGTPHVISPSGEARKQVAQIDGFERLRSIIDLRDQHERFDIPGRSQDGIQLKAEDVQVVYSVFRRKQQPTLEKPYPFYDPDAIERLVYEQTSGDWTVTMTVQIRGELLDFYANHKLNEFLSMVQEPEKKSLEAREAALREASQRLIGENGSDQSQPAPQPAAEVPQKKGGGPEPEKFQERPRITEKFYRASEERSRIRGTQINWVGVGTWNFPSQIIQSRHHEAWRIMHDNQVKGSAAALKSLRSQQRLVELLRLIQTVPLATFRALLETEALPPENVVRGLVLAYHHQINEAYQDYEREIDNVTQQRLAERDEFAAQELAASIQKLEREKEILRETLMFLTRFTGRWV